MSNSIVNDPEYKQHAEGQPASVVRIARRKPISLGLLIGTIVKLRDEWLPSPGNPGFECRDGVLEVWCPRCWRFHTHSWDMGDDHRVGKLKRAHCDSREPLIDYYVSVLAPGDPGYKAHVSRPGRRVERPILALPVRRIVT